MNEQQRTSLFDYVYRKADEAGFMGMDRGQSSAFQSKLENDPELSIIAGERIDRVYIKDTILNKYSKERRYIGIDDVLGAIEGISRENINEEIPDLNNDIFHITKDGLNITCTSTSLAEWSTAIKRFGKGGADPRLVFLTCGGVERGDNEINEAKEILSSYGIASVTVKPSRGVVNLTTLFPNFRPAREHLEVGNLEQMALSFHDHLSKSGLVFTLSLTRRFICSLLAKKFCILTGLAGSGKTKIAHAFAAWISANAEQYRLIAVGADWTTNENIIGYQDALQPSLYRKPSNGSLDVVLRAAEDPKYPYFLILDEMNLSHVERYFADILSAIESDQEIALHSASESLKACEDDALPVPSKLNLPNNLFIVGTVNIDETTYMFSPKVLDRANVIEFRTTAGDIAAFLDAPTKVEMAALAGKGNNFGPSFVAEANASDQLNKTIAADLKDRLTEVFDALVPIGAEFGFRTAYEITRFTHFYAKLTGDAFQFNDAMDAQVLQKLLPKLHGSERRLGPVLKALEGFCEEHQCVASLEKIRRMQDRLKDGFTSFAEA